MTDFILTQAAIWAPALVSVLGIVAMVVGAIAKVKAECNKLKTEELKAELKLLTSQNAELLSCYKVLANKHIKIKEDSADDKKV